MHLLWILLTCAASVLVFKGTESLVSREEFSRGWRIAFWTLSIVGIALGIRLVSLQYLSTPTLRLYGFPFPIAGGESMNGKWRDGLVGNPLAFIADVGGGVAGCLLPLLLAALAARRRRGARFENISTA